MEAIEDARRAAETELGVILRWCFDIPGRPASKPPRRPRGSPWTCGPRAWCRSGSAARRSACRARSSSRTSTGPGPRAAVRAARRETTGPQTVWDALNDLGAERIGHGTSSTQDPELLAHLAEHRIALEVCPTSNIATRAVTDLDKHPITEMVAAGVLVTVNSDDPPMFGTDLNTEYAIAARLLGLDERGVAALAKNAVEASFLDPAGKTRISAEIDAYTEQWLAP